MYTQFEEKGKIFTNRVSKDELEVIIQTSKQKIHGTIHVQVDQRLIDDLNTSKGFLAITNAKIYDGNENLISESKFLAINIDQIVWILPVEEKV
jgi:hypothetical protein